MTKARRVAMLALFAAMSGAAGSGCGPEAPVTPPLPREPAAVAPPATKAEATPPAPAVPSGTALATMERVARAGRYLYVLCRREENAGAEGMRETLARALKPLGGRAEVVEVDVRDPAESPFVKQFALSRAPMPLVLVLAPNGAVTAAMPLRASDAQFREALVGPGTAESLKGIQSGRTVLLCVQGGSTEQNAEALEGVGSVAADPQYKDKVRVVTLHPEDPDEAATLRNLKLDPKAGEAVTVVLSSAGVAGTFRGVTTRAVLEKAISDCTSCGPTG